MRLKTLASLLLAGTLSASMLVYAKEPVNLAFIKKDLKHYHDSGEYDHDISSMMQQAMRYLEMRIDQGKFHGKKPAIVLDIDETSLSNYPDMVRLDFGGTLEEIRQDEDKGEDEAIAPTLKLYRYAKANQIAVFFITGRQEEEREVTEKNLKKAGYVNHDGLILRAGEYKKAPASVYKIAMRKQLADQGYDILLNIGDQKSDLRGGYADKTYKLPNPYYHIP
ncbi:hypothetical protein AQUSIP_03130 [Aquicella siphonis]|uniref:Lipoprotein E n=1 Tax=Aquicella siphonis TaxID=254247 RepID=A0A5E4PEW9_9COXI|nr:HAD family acid phosphatase [Aquicella siphonis]VVC75038.1 hypothetical protein AQUSIP_03130 [Aquicella siphonis]